MDNFQVLEEKANEISFGLMGRFWRVCFGVSAFATTKEIIGCSGVGGKLVLRYKIEKETQ